MDVIQKLEITLDDVNAELKSANQGKEWYTNILHNDIVIKCTPLQGLFCGQAFGVHVKSECVSQWELDTDIRD